MMTSDHHLDAGGATPPPLGPYSPAVAVGDLLFLSGQIAVDPASGTLDPNQSVDAQTKRIWANIAALLAGYGLDLSHVVQAQVYLIEMADFAEMNSAYAAALGNARPARTTVAVAELPFAARIEIAVVAARRP
jgi:2-iminobutanoate/2-iminopropanoate deaminase